MIDIKAAQAEALTKATSWLTQNLVVEEPVAQEPTVVQPAQPPATGQPAISAPIEVAPVVPTKPGLADAIRQNREVRAQASTAQADVTKTRGELEALRKENESLKSLGAATDPFEFLRNRKLTKEQQALWGQAFLYDLKPEVAPQEFRLDLYKAEQAREKAEAAAAEEREAAENAQLEQRSHLDRYANELHQYVQSNPGSSPESELWFTEDGPDGQVQVNHKVYAQSLFATADNLSRRAQKSGQQADLSPANVARVLEAEVSKRLQRRDAKRAGGAQQTQAQVKQGAQAQTTTTLSAQGLGGGPPLPPAKTDQERRERAMAVLAGGK